MPRRACYFNVVLLLHSSAGTNQFRFSGIISAFYSTPCMKYEHKSRQEIESSNNFLFSANHSTAKPMPFRRHLGHTHLESECQATEGTHPTALGGESFDQMNDELFHI